MKLSKSDRIFEVTVYIVLALICFSMLYPIWNTVVISFNNGADTANGGITIWPRAFTLDNYKVVFADKRLWNAFTITVMRTVIGTTFSIFLTAMFAYGLSKSQLIGRKIYMTLAVITMYFSGGLIPSYLLIRNLHLIDTFWVMVIPGAISVWNMIVFMTFFRELPAGLEESATIDGCNYLQTFFRIVLPVSGPILATLSLFTAVTHWNAWFDASIYINKESLFPIQTMLRRIINSSIVSDQLEQITGNSTAAASLRGSGEVTTKSLTMATMMVATLPIMCVYPFVQKYFVKGVMVGAIKG